MSDELATSDPTRIRALSHPLRLRLIEYLADVGEATATQCAEHTGESVASCSFHLRSLAKYGFVEPGERRGREKPWRRTARHLVTRPDAAVPGSRAAAYELAGLSLQRQVERAQEFMAQVDREPEEWVQATVLMAAGVWVTAEELTELNRRISALVDEFSDRQDNPGLRPAGARRSRVFTVLHPDPAPDESASDEASRGRVASDD